MKITKEQLKKIIKEEIMKEGYNTVYVIRALGEKDEETGESLYWSNDDGWVDFGSATQFSEEEKEEFEPRSWLPVPGEWEMWHQGGILDANFQVRG